MSSVFLNHQALSTKVDTASSDFFVNLNFSVLEHRSRTVLLQEPIDLFVVFAQAHKLVCLSHVYSGDKIFLFGRLSNLFLHQIESFDDILDVVFTMDKSNFLQTHFEEHQLKIYLNDNLSINKGIIHNCFSLQEWLGRLNKSS